MDAVLDCSPVGADELEDPRGTRVARTQARHAEHDLDAWAIPLQGRPVRCGDGPFDVEDLADVR